MTKTEALKKNLDFAVEFNVFVAKNPAVMKSVPSKANIIFMTSHKSKINSYNGRIGEAILCEEKSSVWKAIKSKDSWKMEKLVPSC